MPNNTCPKCGNPFDKYAQSRGLFPPQFPKDSLVHRQPVLGGGMEFYVHMNGTQ